jgi:hypothetical protein
MSKFKNQCSSCVNFCSILFCCLVFLLTLNNLTNALPSVIFSTSPSDIRVSIRSIRPLLDVVNFTRKSCNRSATKRSSPEGCPAVDSMCGSKVEDPIGLSSEGPSPVIVHSLPRQCTIPRVYDMPTLDSRKK